MPNNTRNTITPSIDHHPNALHLDVDFYQSILDDADIPDTDKRALIETLWQIITAFVDLGFGVHPLQDYDAPESCGKLPLSKTDCALTPAAMLNCIHPQQDENQPLPLKKEVNTTPESTPS